MKQIKFRVWDHKLSSWNFFDLLSVVGNLPTDCIHNVQQYIGLDDIHGKPIYEGDIVRYESWDRHGEQPITARTDLGEVFFEEGIFYFGRGVWFAANDANFSERTLEVVGNVFENPELLKK